MWGPHISLSSSQFTFHLSASLFVFLLYLLPSPFFFFFFFPWEEKLFYLICTSFLPLSHHFFSRSGGSVVTVTLIISESFVYTTVKQQMFSLQELLCSSKRSALLHLSFCSLLIYIPDTFLSLEKLFAKCLHESLWWGFKGELWGRPVVTVLWKSIY